MLIFAGVLHDLFTVVWIGGLLTMGLVVFEDPGEAKKFTGMVQKRMSRFGFISIAVLLVTGVVLARSGSDFAGLFSFAGCKAPDISGDGDNSRGTQPHPEEVGQPCGTEKQNSGKVVFGKCAAGNHCCYYKQYYFSHWVKGVLRLDL